MRFFADASTVRRARQSFDDAGYTLEAVTARLGPHAFSHLAAGEQAPLVRATRAGDRLDVLARLFLIGGPVGLTDARAALAPLPLEQWVHGGLVSVDADDVRGLLAVRPLGGAQEHLVAHDRPDRSGVPADHVLGVSASTLSLAGATIRRPIEAAFDLGTGCGIQALHAAEHSRRVIASDLNPRAVACATLTMELNGLDHVAVVHGDLFSPVGEQRFDLIVANPPFVISPSSRYLFRDSRAPVDEISRTIVRSAADHLHPGGHCQLLASWAHVRDEDWRQRLAEWFAGTGCDALVIEREAMEPAAHAASWLRQTEPPEHWDEFDAWVGYYEQHRIEAIGFGLITMRRRRDGRPWFRAEEITHELAMPCGDHLGALFELADFLAVTDDHALLDLVLEVSPGVVLDSTEQHGVDGWTSVTRRLRQTRGLCLAGDVDAPVAAIVRACDGRRSLGAVLAEVAAATAMDRAELKVDAVPIVRRLVEKAFLLPVVPAR